MAVRDACAQNATLDSLLGIHASKGAGAPRASPSAVAVSAAAPSPDPAVTKPAGASTAPISDSTKYDARATLAQPADPHPAAASDPSPSWLKKEMEAKNARRVKLEEMRARSAGGTVVSESEANAAQDKAQEKPQEKAQEKEGGAAEQQSAVIEGYRRIQSRLAFEVDPVPLGEREFSPPPEALVTFLATAFKQPGQAYFIGVQLRARFGKRLVPMVVAIVSPRPHQPFTDEQETSWTENNSA